MSNYFASPFKGVPLTEQVTNPNIRVGRYSYYSGYYHGHSFDDCARYLGHGDDVQDKLEIGAFCSIGSGVSFIMAGNQGHRHDWLSTFPFHYLTEEPAFVGAQDGYRPAGDTIVGNDVWLGSEAMILAGVRIGHGAVIGSRALVTKDVGPYTVVGGNPARPIRKRFADEEIRRMLELAWWDWSLEKLTEALPLLCAGDVGALHTFWQERVREQV